MRYLFINSVCGIRSTGRICTDLAQKLESEGHTCRIAYGRMGEVPEPFQKYAVRIGNHTDLKVHALQTRLSGAHGFGSEQATRAFLQWADQYDPQVLWLHNLHGYYIQVETLFAWIKSRPQMQVKWTLHDCWAFTGHCSHFSYVRCMQWKTGCKHCVQLRRYPKCYGLSNVGRNFERKKNAFTGVPNMTLITPSQWLADLVKESFLGEYPVEVQYNSVDTRVFKPTPSDFRARYNLQNKTVILGVASAWDERKGLQDFIRLADLLEEDFVIVLVGVTKKQRSRLPARMIGLGCTNSTRELAELYTMADVFVNPSVEETFGMTTIEALACGTPAIVYKGTACEEIVSHAGGVAIERGAENIYSSIKSSLYPLQKK